MTNSDRNHDLLPAKTLKVWRPRTARKLTTEDAREIRENAVGFVRILAEWRAAENGAAREKDNDSRAEDDLPVGKSDVPANRPGR